MMQTTLRKIRAAVILAVTLVQCIPASAVSLMKPATGAVEIAAPMTAPAASLDKPALHKVIATVTASARRAPRPDLQRQIDKPAYPWLNKDQK